MKMHESAFDHYLLLTDAGAVPEVIVQEQEVSRVSDAGVIVFYDVLSNVSNLVLMVRK